MDSYVLKWKNLKHSKIKGKRKAVHGLLISTFQSVCVQDMLVSRTRRARRRAPVIGAYDMLLLEHFQRQSKAYDDPRRIFIRGYFQGGGATGVNTWGGTRGIKGRCRRTYTHFNLKSILKMQTV